jgi:hypothetical protein
MDDDEDASIDWGAMTLLAQAVLKNGVCKYAYAPELQRKLADPEIFGVINMNVQRQFERTHSLSLYENCARYLKTGSTGFHGVEKWRRLLGTIKYDKDRNALPSTYDSYKVFKSKVLVPAVAEVNRVSNIFVTLHEEKVGRKVERIRFEVSENPQTSFLHESPESDGIRETEGYKALQGIGFDGKLATSVIELMGEQYALNLAAHVKRPGVDNPGGLAFTLFRDRAPVPDRKQQQAAPLPHNKPDEVAKDKQSNEARKASASLTDERRAELRAAYIAAHPGASFNEETGKWNKPAHVTGYRAFERASA